ncbi:hypothetical protein NPIL_386611 [Nephila pilipes]|uniref:Uncharacterized protein n=1 Tax=Nephila pilipes TaxID=299642 RepID=A0A8X6QE90_NEPPI|nr:hypothetical protein NPIL_386611 [Nephila pilipes]
MEQGRSNAPPCHSRKRGRPRKIRLLVPCRTIRNQRRMQPMYFLLNPRNALCTMRDISFGFSLKELNKILTAAEMVEEFVDAAPKWNDVNKAQQSVQTIQHVFCKSSTSNQSIPHSYVRSYKL